MSPLGRSTLLAFALAAAAAAQAPWLSAQVPGALAAPAQETVTYAQATDAGYELWTLDLRTRARARIANLTGFLSIDLVGYAAKDGRRADRPREAGAGTETPHVRLTQHGALYRVDTGGATGLLRVPGQGPARVLLTVPDGAGGEPGLAPQIHVAPDGARAIVSSPLAAGGDVYAVELAPPFHVDVLTAALPPLALSPTSVRIGAEAAWFVAQGALRRADLASSSLAVVELDASAPVHPELVLADDGHALAVVLEKPDGKRRIFTTRDDGAVTAVTEEFDRYSRPNLDHPLGPWLAISPSGAHVGFLEEKSGGKTELHVFTAEAPGPALHVTQKPTFEAYIDSIGVLAFGGPDLLCFFAGDIHEGDFIPGEELRAADMYVVDVSDPAQPTFCNITRTNGQMSGPFTEVGALAFEAAFVGPAAERIYLVGTDDDGVLGLSSFRIDGGASLEGVNLDALIANLSAPPSIVGGPQGPVVVALEQEAWPPFSQDESKVECTGALAPLGAATVRVRASDKADPTDTKAKVWFDGLVALGQEFELDAALAGQSKLGSDVYLHFLDADDGTTLQRVELHTSCSQELLFGDRFGAATLVGAVAELDPEDGVVDLCLGGEDDPVTLELRYVGGGCDASAHSQDPAAVSCAGAADAPWVHVLASDKANPGDGSAKVWFEDVVALGDSIELLAANAGEDKLKHKTFVHVFDDAGVELQTLEFRTTCHGSDKQPLVVGDRFGSVELVTGAIKGQPAPDSACHFGDPRKLTFTYDGGGCGPTPFGPRVRLVNAAGDAAPVSVQLDPTQAVLATTTSRWSGAVAVLTAGLDGASDVLRVMPGAGTAVPPATLVSGVGLAPEMAFAGADRLFHAAQVAPGAYALFVALPNGAAFPVVPWTAPILVLGD